MDKMTLTGPQKAAILFLSLGEDVASEVIKNMDDEEIQTISSQISRLKNVPLEDTQKVLDEFYRRTSSGDILPQGDENYIKRMIAKALGERRAEEIIREIASSHKRDKGSFHQSLRHLDPKTIAILVSTEHPQVISVILAHLPPERAGQVLGLLPESLRMEVILRFSHTETITSEVLEIIDEVMREKVDRLGGQESQKLGGIQKVAEMLNHMDKISQEALLDLLGEKEPALADEIRQLMFSFEDLILLDNRSVQSLLQEVSNQQLAVALKAASDTIKNHFFKNMTERAANMLKEDMEIMGPVRLRDVESAQQNIVRMARRLEKEGKLIIRGRGGDEVLV